MERQTIPHILIVDDDPVNIDILMEALEEQGYLIDSAQNGQQAWDLLQAAPHKYSALLLDRMMPVMDGMELLQLIKKDSQMRNIPVIMQTAAAMSNQIVEGLQGGAYYYLIKPFDVHVVNSILRAAVNDYQAQLRLQHELDQINSTSHLLQKAHYRFKTLAEARRLAISLAQGFPEPHKAAKGLSELLINAIEHGNLGITYAEKTQLNESKTWEEEVLRREALPENQHKIVTVYFMRTTEKISVGIEDQGKGFAWEEYLTMSPKRAFDNHGRGIAMAKLLSFDTLVYDAPGNRVTATTRLRPS